MSKVTNINNSDGFTIVEIVIASGLLIVLALFISSLLANSARQQKRLEKRASDSDFVQSIALTARLHPVPSPSP